MSLHVIKNNNDTICFCLTKKLANKVIDAFEWMENECSDGTSHYHIKEVPEQAFLTAIEEYNEETDIRDSL